VSITVKQVEVYLKAIEEGRIPKRRDEFQGVAELAMRLARENRLLRDACVKINALGKAAEDGDMESYHTESMKKIAWEAMFAVPVEREG
jgi:hypothetical protein